MANEEQLAILRQGVEVWNKWREEYPGIEIDLNKANLSRTNLTWFNFIRADLSETNLSRANLGAASLSAANLNRADLTRCALNRADFGGANLSKANLIETNLTRTDLSGANLNSANLKGSVLSMTNLRHASLINSDFSTTFISSTIFGGIDLSEVRELDEVHHSGPSSISTDTFVLSKGRIPETFLRGCGLSDWEIEQVKLYNPGLSNDQITQIQYRVYDLRATQAVQISPLFISYSHANSEFVEKIESQLNKKGVRYWRDIHDMKAGRIEKQIDRAITQNPTVLLVLSENSLNSDWVEHEVRTARELEKDMERDVLCPIALDDSWKSSKWPKRIMEQIMEYNILDFSAWEDDVQFEGMFRRLIDGLQLFYKG